jgi:hypothetical protein
MAGRQWTRQNPQYAFVPCMPTYGQQAIAIHGQKSPYLGMLFQIWQFSAEVYFTLGPYEFRRIASADFSCSTTITRPIHI